MTDDDDQQPPAFVPPRYCPPCLDRWAWGSTQEDRDRIHPACLVALQQAEAR